MSTLVASSAIEKKPFSTFEKKNNLVKKRCSSKRLLERNEHKSSSCSRSIWKAWLEQELYQYVDIILRKTLNIRKCFNPRRKDFRQLTNLCVSDAQAKKDFGAEMQQKIAQEKDINLLVHPVPALEQHEKPNILRFGG